MKTVYLNKFKVIDPKNKVAQEALLQWTVAAHQVAETYQSDIATAKLGPETIQTLFKRFGVKAALIGQRFTECDDIVSTEFKTNPIYQVNAKQPHGADIHTRANFFSDRAFSVFKKIYDGNQAQQKPDHLIHVTCTGYISPSAAQRIVTEKFWDKTTAITHAYHMGCYAALPAVRLAKSLVRDECETNENFTTDIVHTEMCSLHMNPSAQTPEQMVVQTLFADGHIKYSASAEKSQDGKNLKVIVLLEKVVPDSQHDMSWIPTSWGLQMNLSRDVPDKIKSQLKLFSNELFIKAGLDVPSALKSVFAIHPGGPKIIDSVQQCLELADHQISESRDILFQRGNMSSATLPHVWDKILEQNYPVGTKVISFAFGPGLTLFGSVFEIC